jgi:hypothetical protein
MPTILDTLLVLFGMAVMAVVGIAAAVYLVNSGDLGSALLVIITDCAGIALVYGGANCVL